MTVFPAGQTTMSASAPVVIASDQSTITVSLAANQSINLTQVGGSAISRGSAVAANSVPVVVATDQSFTTLGTIDLTGSVAETQSGSWTVTLQPGNTPNTTPWLVDINTGTANALSGYIASTATAAATIIAAQGSNVSIFVGSMSIGNSSATQAVVTLNDTNSTKLIVPPHGMNNPTFIPPLEISANLPLTFTTAPAVTSILASAQAIRGTTTGVAPPSGGGGGGYTGPGDIVTFEAWYGLRGYSTAVAATGTQNAIRVRRDSDNTEMDIVILTTGALDVASATSFKGGANLFLVTYYDQTGNGHHDSESNTAYQPGVLLTGGGSSGLLPTLTFNGSQGLTTWVSIANIDPPYAAYFVAKRTSQTSVESSVWNTNARMGFYNLPDTIHLGLIFNPPIEATATDNVWHMAVGVLRGDATTGLSVDGGTEVTRDIGPNGTGTLLILHNTPGGLTGQAHEVGLVAADVDSTKRTALKANLTAYGLVA